MAEHLLFRTNLSGNPKILDVPNLDGLRYLEFRKTLNISYCVLLFNMALPWAMIITLFYVFHRLGNSYWSYALILPGAIWSGFWLQSYNLHFHEAAHFNLHKDRRLNDAIANFLFTPFVGLFIEPYRISHWQHHRFLGQSGDTEITYRSQLGYRELLDGLSGLYLIKMLCIYFVNMQNRNSSHKTKLKLPYDLFLSLIVFMAVNCLITIVLFKLISISASISWVISLFVIGPFINQIRQTLEHRPYIQAIDLGSDPEKCNAANRIFGRDLFSKYFGAAGFNSHLLHHLDPSISYTRFYSIEKFLLNSEAKEYIEANRTSYLECFKSIITQSGK